MFKRAITVNASTFAVILSLGAPLASAHVVEGFWNTGHGVYCTYDSTFGGYAECNGYRNQRGWLVFTLKGNATTDMRRIAGDPYPESRLVVNPPQAGHHPPARWLHITHGLACRSGPGQILVQCRDPEGSFALSAHGWVERERDCSILYGRCGWVTNHSGKQHTPTTGAGGSGLGS